MKSYRGRNIQHPFLLLSPFSCPTCCIYGIQNSSAHSCVVVCVNKYKSKKNNFGELGPLPACLGNWALRGAGRVFFKRREAEENSSRILAQPGHISSQLWLNLSTNGWTEESMRSWGGGCGALHQDYGRAWRG